MEVLDAVCVTLRLNGPKVEVLVASPLLPKPYVALSVDKEALKAYHKHYGMDAVEDLVLSSIEPLLRQILRSQLNKILKEGESNG